MLVWEAQLRHVLKDIKEYCVLFVLLDMEPGVALVFVRDSINTFPNKWLINNQDAKIKLQ